MVKLMELYFYWILEGNKLRYFGVKIYLIFVYNKDSVDWLFFFFRCVSIYFMVFSVDFLFLLVFSNIEIVYIFKLEVFKDRLDLNRKDRLDFYRYYL